MKIVDRALANIVAAKNLKRISIILEYILNH